MLLVEDVVRCYLSLDSKLRLKMEKLKNIRFNLRFFNGEDSFEAVHSVEELEDKLRTNQIAFDDLMAVFLCGQLARWLECHGDKDLQLLEKLKKINLKAPNKEIVKDLFAALGFCFEDKEIDRMIISYEFPQRLKEATAESDKVRENKINSMQNEIDSYEAICRQLPDANGDWERIRKTVKQILDKYYPLVRLDIGRFYTAIKKSCPLAILALLMEKKGRELFVQTATSPIAETYSANLPSVENYLKFMKGGSGKFYISVGGSNYLQDPYPITWVDDYSKTETSYRQLIPKGGRVLILNNSGVYVKGVEDGEVDVKDWADGELNGMYKILHNCSFQLQFKTKAFLAYVEL